MFDLENVLIISDYDMGYQFTVYWNGIYHEYRDELSTVCYHIIDIQNDFEKFKELAKIGVYPDVIIICEDGCIDIIRSE